MKTVIVLVLVLSGFVVAQAQDDSVDMSDVIQGAQQWAQQNLDTNVLNSLSDVDERAVQQFFVEIQYEYQGQYVVDIASLRDTAQTILPLLESRNDTQPYADWLKAQMDYLDVADEIRITTPVRAKGTNQPPQPVSNPTPQIERALWAKKVSTTNAWPASAKEYVPQLKPIFSAQKVPPELVWYLAGKESGFDHHALSPAGAAGLFQLLPDTAASVRRSLWPRYQRVISLSRARLLPRGIWKYLHDRFKDWRLALASYNAGEGTVQKLLDRYKASDYDSIAQHLPAETQMYVPRVEAVIQKREGASLEQLSVPQG